MDNGDFLVVGQKDYDYAWLIRLNTTGAVVENTVIVELKSVEKVQDLHKKQLLTYLRLANKPLGLLINFNQVLLKDGISRIINTPKEAL